MRTRDDITKLDETYPPYRHRGLRKNADVFTTALSSGEFVELAEGEEFDELGLMRLANRLNEQAFAHRMQQISFTFRQGGKRVLSVQWYRETPGDLIRCMDPVQLQLPGTETM